MKRLIILAGHGAQSQNVSSRTFVLNGFLGTGASGCTKYPQVHACSNQPSNPGRTPLGASPLTTSTQLTRRSYRKLISHSQHTRGRRTKRSRIVQYGPATVGEGHNGAPDNYAGGNVATRSAAVRLEEAAIDLCAEQGIFHPTPSDRLTSMVIQFVADHINSDGTHEDIIVSWSPFGFSDACEEKRFWGAG